MPGRAVILDGTPPDAPDLERILAQLQNALADSAAEVRTLTLREMRVAHCLGCFECWTKTPGICVENDAGREIARAIANCDTLVFFTPVTFGGYSPELKRAADRLIPLLLPTLELVHGEVHHPYRYSPPRVVGVGVQARLDPEEARIFQLLVGRNAINLRAPSHAADVLSTQDGPDTIRRRLEELLARNDRLPLDDWFAPIAPPPGAPLECARRVLLINGSPKIKSPSTSAVIGEYLLKRMAGSGWETRSWKLQANLCREDGRRELLDAVDWAGLVVLAFPLYVDSLPFLVTKALTILAAHPGTSGNGFVALCNNGLAEAFQNSIALAICHRFAVHSGMAWAGALALPAGEALSSGKPIEGSDRSRPPFQHLRQALDIAAAALANRHPIPSAAIRRIARNPIPMAPFALWRRLFVTFGNRDFRLRAARNGVSAERMLEQPYLTAADLPGATGDSAP